MSEILEFLFDPDWARSALLLALFSTAVVVGVFTYLNRYTQKSYFSLWTIAWIFYALWLGVCLRMEETPQVKWLIMARRAFIGTSALCMFWGSFDLVNTRRTQRELFCAIGLILLWSYVAAYHVQDHLWITVPVFVLLAAAGVYSGILYLQHRRTYRGAALLAYGFIGWGLHLLLFPAQPYLPPHLLVFGYFTTAVLALFIALGMVVLVLEEAHERQRVLLDEYKRGLISRRQLEQEMAVSEQKYRALFQVAGDAIFLVGLDSLEILEVNEKARELMGLKKNEPVPKSLLAICPDLNLGGATLWEKQHRVEELIQPSREFMLLRANGSRVPCEGTVNLVECNHQPALLITAQEITERKKLEQQLRRSEKLSALGQLVAGVAHELNNPLAVIMGYAQLLTTQEHPVERLRADLQKILHESERAAKIVRNLLTFARPREPQLAPVDINRLILNVTETHQKDIRDNTIAFHARLAEDLPPTMADAHQMEQVFTNLLTNAIQALSEHKGQRKLEVLTEQQTNCIRITVADSGPGIPKEIASKIFDPFFTTKGPGKGTGLGLSICHTIVEEHHGRLWVESEKGCGSRFVIELPIIKCAPKRPETAKTSPSLSPALPHSPVARRILLVDDEPGIVDVLKVLLEENGHHVETAHNGAEALQRIQTANFDLIISDLCMPDLGGEALYHEIQKRSPSLARRIIFITGDTVSATSRRFLESTGNRWFGKPFNLDELETAVRCLLQQSAAPAD